MLIRKSYIEGLFVGEIKFYQIFKQKLIQIGVGLTAMQTIINTFKVDEGISEKLEITKNETITGFILSD